MRLIDTAWITGLILLVIAGGYMVSEVAISGSAHSWVSQHWIEPDTIDCAAAKKKAPRKKAATKKKVQTSAKSKSGESCT